MTLTTNPEHAARARQTYAEQRPVRAALRRGDLTIADAMRDQPAGLADRTLFEIVLMAPQYGRARLAAINGRAVNENINLAITLQRADQRTREWVAANALPHGRTSPRSAARCARQRRLWAQLHENDPVE
jgi:hypothetical protein